MFACVLAVSSLCVGDPLPESFDPIGLRLVLLRYTLQDIRDTETGIQRLKDIVMRSPHLAKRCAEDIEHSRALQRELLCAAGAMTYELFADLGLRMWPFNVWKCCEERRPGPKSNK